MVIDHVSLCERRRWPAAAFHRSQLRPYIYICVPLVEDGDDAGAVDADLLPRRLRHVEVGARRVAPASPVGGDGVVGRAQVGGGDGDGVAGLAPPGLAGVALDVVALAAGRAVVEQHLAQRRVQHPVPLVVQVVVPARAACRNEARGRVVSIVRYAAVAMQMLRT
jgi:hypothetical protein